jgi:hypothetical protein
VCSGTWNALDLEVTAHVVVLENQLDLKINTRPTAHPGPRTQNAPPQYRERLARRGNIAVTSGLLAQCGERAAAMYSLIGSCKLNKIDPESYLRYVFERIADHPINRIDELLPWNVVLTSPMPVSQAA